MQPLLDAEALTQADLFAAQQLLQGVPRDRPGRADSPAAAVPAGRPTASADHGRANKVESYNRFSSRCRFDNAGLIAANDPEEQEKVLKFSTLLTNAVICHTTLDMMMVIRELIVEG